MQIKRENLLEGPQTLEDRTRRWRDEGYFPVEGQLTHYLCRYHEKASLCEEPPGVPMAKFEDESGDTRIVGYTGDESNLQEFYEEVIEVRFNLLK